MRVTNKMLSNNFLRDMRYNLKNLQRLQEQMTSGKEIKKPSDDPFKVARAMQMHTDIGANKQYNDNISDTINWLDTTDTALNQMGNVFQRVNELMISAGNGGYGPSERRAIKDEINQKIGEFGQILNTSFDGTYVFGGTRGITKPVEVKGGVEYKDTKNIVVGDLSDAAISSGWKSGTTTGTLKAISFDFTDSKGVASKVEIDLDSTAPKNINELAESINNKLNAKNPDLKLKVIPNVVDKSLMFVSSNDTDIKIGAVSTGKSLPPTIAALSTADKTIKKATIIDNGNAKLYYYKNGGGEIDPKTIVPGTDSDYEYKMLGTKLLVEISQGVTMDYSVGAKEVLEFKDKDGKDLDLKEIFQRVTNHLDGKNDKGDSLDNDAIKKLLNEDLQDIKSAMDNILKVRSEVGAKQNRMDSAKDRNTEENFNMTEILSHTEDIDITEKTMEFAVAQSVYLASLQVSAKVIQPTLMDYLR